MKQTSSSFFSSIRSWIWAPLLLLAILLFYGLASLPVVSETNPTFHVAFRYLDRGSSETGLPNAFLAVLLDYRSFDLILLSLFSSALTLVSLLFCVVEDIPISFRDRGLVFIALLSSLFLLILGWLEAREGSNWMDYEGLSGLWGAGARVHGAIATLILVLIALTASFIWGWRVWSLGKENRFGHR